MFGLPEGRMKTMLFRARSTSQALRNLGFGDSLESLKAALLISPKQAVGNMIAIGSWLQRSNLSLWNLSR
jgi:hypothetical protein